jgi:hypothetical protein
MINETAEVILSHVGKMELRNGSLWLCVGDLKDGLRWRNMLSEKELRDLITAKLVSEVGLRP